MKSSNKTMIRQAFTKQADQFENSHMGFSKKEYMNYAITKIAPELHDSVLEVASGTCVCGRAIAPHVKNIICLDMTPAMLSVGKTEAEKSKLHNMHFILGDAAELPFLDNSFDTVLSRLAFHHFPDVETPFAEMVRVLRPGGKLVLIDMEASEKSLCKTRDKIEQMRDPSHIHNLSQSEMLSLYKKHSLTVTYCETTLIPVDLQNWMNLTQTPHSVQEQILQLFEAELNGGKATGFEPYSDSSGIRFDQHWDMIIGIKE